MITAELAQEITQCYYDCNNMEYTADREIIIAACKGERECTTSLLPLSLEKKYRKQGYTVIEEPNKNGHWQTRIKW